jgi:hypothetical protein
MAFTFQETADNGGTDTSGTVTLAGAPSSGELVVAYVNTDVAEAITASGGASWTTAVDETPPASGSAPEETARHALFWKIAGASEPSSYTFSWTSSAEWRAIVQVYSSATAAEIDLAASSVRGQTQPTSMLCTAINGRTVAANSLSIVAGGKDRRNVVTPELYTSADNSFGNVDGDTGDQYTAMASRIFVAGGLQSYNVDIDVADSNDGGADYNYNIHISFVESSGGTTIIVPTGPVR